MSANRVNSELTQNERLYNVEATNNVHVSGKQVRGFYGLHPKLCVNLQQGVE